LNQRPSPGFSISADANLGQEIVDFLPQLARMAAQFRALIRQRLFCLTQFDRVAGGGQSGPGFGQSEGPGDCRRRPFGDQSERITVFLKFAMAGCFPSGVLCFRAGKTRYFNVFC
jgi:hypothetical protein